MAPRSRKEGARDFSTIRAAPAVFRRPCRGSPESLRGSGVTDAHRETALRLAADLFGHKRAPTFERGDGIENRHCAGRLVDLHGDHAAARRRVAHADAFE